MDCNSHQLYPSFFLSDRNLTYKIHKFFCWFDKQNWFYLAFLLLFKPFNSQIFQFLCVRLDFPFQHKIKQFEIFAFKLFFFVFFRWKIQIKNKGMDI